MGFDSSIELNEVAIARPRVCLRAVGGKRHLQCLPRLYGSGDRDRDRGITLGRDKEPKVPRRKYETKSEQIVRVQCISDEGRDQQ